MTEPQNSEARLKRLRLLLSAAVILFGVLMMAATLTSFGPSKLVGFAFGGSFVVYGAFRLYQTLRR